jgi:PAS domain S-box-containing protein
MYNDNKTRSDLLAEIESLRKENISLKELQSKSNLDILTMLQNAVDTSGEIIFMTDLHGLITYINPEFTRVYGFTAEEIIGKTTPRILKSGQMDQKRYDFFWETILNKQIIKGELINRTKDGQYITVEGSANAIINEQDEIIGFLAVQRDTTDKKNTEEKLRANQQMLSLVLDNFPGEVFWKDLNSIYLGCNTAFAKAAGLNDSKEIIGKSDYDLPWASSEADAYLADDKFVMKSQQKKLGIIETQLRADGQIIWLETNKLPLVDQNGNVIGVLVTSNDITERKKVEEKLTNYQMEFEIIIGERTQELKSTVNRLKNEIVEREQIELDLIKSREEFKTLADNLPDIIIRHDKDLNPVYANTKTRFTGFLNLDDMTYNNSKLDTKTASSPWHYLIEKTFQTGDIQKSEFDHESNGNKNFYEIQTVPEFSAGKEVESVLAVIRDLTERKMIEEQIQMALEGKDVLLREIHHRVKNNLQSIIYLIDMQIEESPDIQLLNSMQELKSKVKTMSIVHEQLYKSNNLSQIDFEEYLKSLLSNLSNMFRSNRNVELKFHTSEYHLNIETVLPCGMIINELITNSIKYAFPEGFTRGKNWQPTISVLFEKDTENFSLTVEDNGIGLPHEINWKEADSLGLKLVNIWTTYQLGGTIEVTNNAGTKFIIKFNKGFEPRN